MIMVGKCEIISSIPNKEYYLFGMALCILHQIPQVAIQVLKHSYCAIICLFWFSLENNSLRRHLSVISPEIVGL